MSALFTFHPRSPSCLPLYMPATPSPRDPRSCADSSTGQMHRPPLSPSSPPSRPPLLPLCPLLRPPKWQRPSQKLALEIAFEASSVREDQRACTPDTMRFNLGFKCFQGALLNPKKWWVDDTGSRSERYLTQNDKSYRELHQVSIPET